MRNDLAENDRASESVLDRMAALNLPTNVAGGALRMQQILTSISLLDLAQSLADSTGVVRGLGLAGAIEPIKAQAVSALFETVHCEKAKDLRDV